MKTLVKFLKVTLVGGLLVVLPLWVSLLLLLKAINGALKLLLSDSQIATANYRPRESGRARTATVNLLCRRFDHTHPVGSARRSLDLGEHT